MTENNEKKVGKCSYTRDQTLLRRSSFVGKESEDARRVQVRRRPCRRDEESYALFERNYSTYMSLFSLVEARGRGLREKSRR